MSNTFSAAIQEATAGIRQCDLAQAMADATPGKKKDARNWVANLSRIQNGKQIPRTATINQIADAIGKLTNRSPSETEQLKSRLSRAAAESDEYRRLREDCSEALAKSDLLDKSAIPNMVDHLGISVMKKIIEADKRGEEIGEQLFEEASQDLQRTAVEYAGGTVVNAGRARIVIDGEVTPAQMQVLKNAAGMIESVLSL